MIPQGPEPIVKAYHGTSSSIAHIIEREGFQLSRNTYDWLGDGVYFFQDGLLRAWEWAGARHGEDAAIIGADIHIVNCLDMLDLGWNEVLSDGYDGYIQLLRKTGRSEPTQSGRAHPLDREVINYTVSVLNDNGIPIACVRASFREGRPVYPNSAFFDRSHIQIAVRDPDTCIQRHWREH